MNEQENLPKKKPTRVRHKQPRIHKHRAEKAKSHKRGHCKFANLCHDGRRKPEAGRPV